MNFQREGPVVVNQDVRDPFVSVVLCSHNGSGFLGRTLANLEELDFPCEQLEIILIDNASTDGTFQIMQKWTPHCAKICAQEPRKGKSYALNAGIKLAKGDFIAFIDDDILVQKNWIRAYVEAAATHTAETVFTGCIELDWPSKPTRWQKKLETQGQILGATGKSEKSDPFLTDFKRAKGGNLFVRRNAATETSFDEDRLNYGGSGSGGEDTQFAREASHNGNSIVFAPKARVRHIVRSDQMSLQAYIKRRYRIAQGQVNRDGVNSKWMRPVIAGLPLGLPIVMLTYLIKAILYLAVLRTDRSVINLSKTVNLLAQFKGFLSQQRQ